MEELSTPQGLSRKQSQARTRKLGGALKYHMGTKWSNTIVKEIIYY